MAMDTPEDQVKKAKRLLQNEAYGSVTEQLGEYFRTSDMTWLLDENDLLFQQKFSPEVQGGWLDTGDDMQEDATFWRIIGEAPEGGELPFELKPFLEKLLSKWASAKTTGVAIRPDSIELVEGYKDMWQGYDAEDEVWKYFKDTEKPSGREPEGWVVSSVAFPAQQEGAQEAGTASSTTEPPSADELAVTIVERMADAHGVGPAGVFGDEELMERLRAATAESKAQVDQMGEEDRRKWADEASRLLSGSSQ